MKYNFLKDAKYIRTATSCRHDSTTGYSADFSVNADVDGWDIYSNIYMYGCWNNVLFGTSSDHICFIQRSHNIHSLEAEHYYFIEIVMKITPDKDVSLPTTGKIMWLRTDDNAWSEDKSIYFNVTTGNNWQRYIINVGPERWWQGNINNLRVYPFIDGHKRCRFGIKEIKIISNNTFSCSETSCDFYTKYDHPCLGGGKPASCTSGKNKSYYTTLSGINDELIVNIDDYGDYLIKLGDNYNIPILSLCRIIEKNLNNLSIGGYNFAEVSATIDNKICIKSGTIGGRSSVEVTGGTASEELTFFSNGKPIYTKFSGISSASHYDAISSVRFNYTDISKLLNYSDAPVYSSKELEYNVEAGNKDFYNNISSNTENKYLGFYYNVKHNNTGNTVIDISHPVTNNGIINHIYINCGSVQEDSRVYILRPHANGDYSVVDYVSLPMRESGGLYTSRHDTTHVECHVNVCKGDVLAMYNINVAISISESRNLEDANFFSYPGKPHGRISVDKPHSTGVVGFQVYARGNRLKDSIVLDIDFGCRVNASHFYIKGYEVSDKFEYNVAICKDIDWEVDCRGETHRHIVEDCYALNTHIFTHKNIPYGIECLSDGRITTDGGKQGTTFSLGSDGIITSGYHSYFYVNGDGEWDYGLPGNSGNTSPIVEFSRHTWCTHRNVEYIHDPIYFTLLFPLGCYIDIYKTKMYFKDGRNFKHFKLQYYIDSATTQMTGKTTGYYLIPEFDSIFLDGVKFTKYSDTLGEQTKHISEYLFLNPTAWADPVYENGVCINQSSFMTARDLSWNVMEHNFKPVKCNGYRLVVDHHVSTKMTEFEVYSFFPIDPSLVDNAKLEISIDGTYWQSVYFSNTSDSSIIEATVNASPRYMRLHLIPQDLWFLCGFGLSVTDSVVSNDCTNQILLDFKDPVFSDITELEFKNEYNNIADFKVSLPTSFLHGNNKVLSLSLDGTDDNNSSVVIRKNKDFAIELSHSNVANNCSLFALKNILSGKQSYLLDNITNRWAPYKVLTHNVSLNYTSNFVGSYHRILFNSISTRFVFIHSQSSFYFDTLVFYFSGDLIEYTNIYFSSFLVTNSYGETTVQRNGVKLSTVDNINLQPFTIFYSDFSSGDIDYAVWALSGDYYINKLEISYETIEAGDQSYVLWPVIIPDSKIGITSVFPLIVSFYFRTKFTVGYNGSEPFAIEYHFLKDTNIVFYVKIETNNGSNVLKIINQAGVVILNVNVNYYCSILELKRVSDSLEVRLIHDNTSYVNKAVTISEEAINNISLYFKSYTASIVLTNYSNFAIDFVELQALNFVSHTDMVCVDFGETVTVDRCVIHYSDSASAFNMHCGYSLSGYYYDVPIVSDTETTFYKYLAINLGSYHDLWFIRNYGDMSNKLLLAIGDNIEVSKDSTDDITEVNWGQKYNTCLLVFEGISGSVNYTDCYNSNRVFNNIKTEISSDHFISKGSSCYFKGDSILGIVDNGDFNFKSESFGICFSFFLASNIYVDKVLCSKWGNISTSKSFKIGVTSDKYVFFTYTTDGITSKTITSVSKVSVGCWVTVEISRDNWYLYLFIDGILEKVHGIAFDSLNDTLSTLYLGGLENDSLNRFYGYIDNFFVRTGFYIHNNNYSLENYQHDLLLYDRHEYKWLRIVIPTTDVYTLDKLGLYPNINNPMLYSGDYNCDWISLGNSCTNHVNTAYNIAYDYSYIQASSKILDCYPENVVDKNKEVNSFNECWGFSSSDPMPTLTIIFNDYYLINKVTLLHGAMDGSGYYNNDFVLKGYPTASGTSYVELANITGNMLDETTHEFDSIIIQRLDLVISRYTSGNNIVDIYTDEGVESTVLDGGFLRRIGIYTSTYNVSISSEEYPVLALNLHGKFSISDYIFECDKCQDNTWLNYAVNNEQFVSYSDSNYDDPRKVFFSTSKDRAIYVDVHNSFMSYSSFLETTLIKANVLLDVGSYDLTWEAYNSIGDDTFCIEVAGLGKSQLFYPENELSGGWSLQKSSVTIQEAGLYDINFCLPTGDVNGYDKGVRNIVISKKVDYVRWLSFIDNTATDFSFDGDQNNKKPHILTLIKVLSSDRHKITEYPRWWLSNISTLSYNYFMVKTGSRSLQIDYPVSSGIDYINYREADNFIEDKVWMEKDFLSFWWYIDDVTKLDTDYGGIGFGNMNAYSVFDTECSVNASYGWDMSSLSLKSGWNKIKLQFSNWDSIYPNSADQQYQNPSTNFRDTFITSFIIYYRGLGTGPIKMFIDDLCIQRCVYDELINNKPALCLSYNECAEVNLSNLSIERGTISFYAKMYNDSSGRTIFGDLTSRTLFSIISSNNDIVTFGVRQGTWFEFGVGDVCKNYKMFAWSSGSENSSISPSVYIDYDEVFHVTVMWSNTGIDMSNRDTFRLYINGELMWYSKETWDISSYSVTRLTLGGGASSTAFNNKADGCAIFSDLKVYNYCLETSDFDNDFEDSNLIDPDDFVYLSLDGVNFFGRNSNFLPLTSSGILPGESVKVYIKSIKTNEFKKIKNKTANLLVDWVTAV